MPLGLGQERVKMETSNGKTGVKWFIQIMGQKRLLATVCIWMLFLVNGMRMTVQSKLLENYTLLCKLDIQTRLHSNRWCWWLEDVKVVTDTLRLQHSSPTFLPSNPYETTTNTLIFSSHYTVCKKQKKFEGCLATKVFYHCTGFDYSNPMNERLCLGE